MITSVQRSTVGEMLHVLRDYLATASALPQVRCPKCGRHLFDGWMFGETKCGKCGHLVRLNGPVS